MSHQSLPFAINLGFGVSGLGFWLMQQYDLYSLYTPPCPNTGWQASSHFSNMNTPPADLLANHVCLAVNPALPHHFRRMNNMPMTASGQSRSIVAGEATKIELQSKLLASPSIYQITLPYISTFKEFRLKSNHLCKVPVRPSKIQKEVQPSSPKWRRYLFFFQVLGSRV